MHLNQLIVYVTALNSSDMMFVHGSREYYFDTTNWDAKFTHGTNSTFSCYDYIYNSNQWDTWQELPKLRFYYSEQWN